ncbi:hypothetical protein like AT3G09510 [Hibiscus trionum]|uniref:RNase H type-1 domain-containing protein n=1 Tax=Hibiscus trionum TaxID=183268 RepID=A0A9W7HJ13_HIBTR|nr:hypothetical protein like AT3G09510 [Hibiscus trionum]
MIQWQALLAGLTKFNFDSTFDQIEGRSISGMIGRSNEGQIMEACTIRHLHVADPFIAEANACLQAVLFMKDLRFRSVIVEGDSLTVIQKVNSSNPDMSILNPIIQEIKTPSRDFDSIQFRFTYRKANGLAYLLAKEGCSLDSTSY